MGKNVEERNSDVENQAEEKTDRKERSKPMAGNGTSAQKPEDEGKNWRKKIKAIFTVHQAPYLRMWNIIFVISCVFAVSMDPLFFYVVIIDQDKKCLQMDKTLRIVALLMRSLTDVIFLVHFICEICDSVQKTKLKREKRNSWTGVLENGLFAPVEQTRGNSNETMETKPGTSKTNTPKNGPSAAGEQTGGNSGKKSKIRELIQYNKEIAQNMSWLSIIFDVLALLPLPQLLIVFYPMKRSGFVEHQKVVNVFLLGQYVPRIFRIHLSAKVFKRSNGIWAKSLFNLFLYIFASHVLGAFWYLFSIQREVSCWYETCVNPSIDYRGCTDTFYCDSQNTTARNITLLNEHCPLDTSDGASSSFNFGIFLDSLKNQNTEQKKFIKKFLYSFWWGLRNLSNFGTNLTTSTYVWENLFAILISFIGLLLFLYLIGNVQVFGTKWAREQAHHLRLSSPAFFSGVFGTKSESDCSVCRHFAIFPKYRDIIDIIDNIAIFGRKPTETSLNIHDPKNRYYRRNIADNIDI